jgi:hypothetical protein
MGIPVSLVLIAVGAILAFAVNQSDPNPPVDVDVVGWILMLVGLAGLLFSLLLWERLGPGAWAGIADPLADLPARLTRAAAPWWRRTKSHRHRRTPPRRLPSRSCSKRRRSPRQ